MEVDPMMIQPKPEGRDALQQVVKRERQPTRRQKAQILLGLAEGVSVEEIAMKVGISKAMIEYLRARYTEEGLAGVGIRATRGLLIRLVRPGVGSRRYRLAANATVADLLRRVRAITTDQLIYIGDDIATETTPLYDGAVVAVIPRSKDSAGSEPWRATISSFDNDDLFQEYRDALKESRDSFLPVEDPEA
jgi:hypothetical protein